LYLDKYHSHRFSVSTGTGFDAKEKKKSSQTMFVMQHANEKRLFHKQFKESLQILSSMLSTNWNGNVLFFANNEVILIYLHFMLTILQM